MTKLLATCPACSAAVPSDAPDGLCPRCVVNQALRDELGNTMLTDVGARDDAGLDVPNIEELTALLRTRRIPGVAAEVPELEIVEELGRGGMGVVFLARQPSLDRQVAVKVLPRQLSSDPAFAERFEREARTLARLSHPNIVGVFDTGLAGDYSYFVMEYVDGSTLRSLLREGALGPHEALELIPQLCAGLQAAHDQGIVHRDLKPENVLVTDDGRVKITDFGLAKLLGPDSKQPTLTLTNQVMGTPHYMAPEQLRPGSAVDHRVDLYALGVLLYEALTGELPIGRFAAPSLVAGTSPHVDAVVFRCLEADPERRFARAREVQAGLEGAPLPALPGPRRPAGPRDPGAERQRLLQVLDASDHDASWSPLHFVGSILSLGLLPMLHAERQLAGHAAEHARTLAPPVDDPTGRRARYRRHVTGAAERGARRRRLLALLLFGLCATLAGTGMTLLGNNPSPYAWEHEDEYDALRSRRWQNDFRPGAALRFEELDRERDMRWDRYHRRQRQGTALVGAGAGLWLLTLLVFPIAHWRGVGRHERNQLCLGILHQGYDPELANQALSTNRRQRKTAGWGAAGATFLMLFLSIPTFGLAFFLWLPVLLGRPLGKHVEREGSLPALATAAIPAPEAR